VSTSAGYSGTPLAKKLGIKAGGRVLLSGAPEGFTLDELPDGVTLHRTAGRGDYDVVIAFCGDRRALERRFRSALGRIPADGAIWVAWPKRASGVPTDLDDGVVRAHGLGTGLVDTKVCAIDATWSGLRFVVRTADRPQFRPARGGAPLT
jgi:hypothetical protein